MSKPIKCTDAILDRIVAEFRESVKSSKMFDGRISYSKSFKWEKEEKATVTFSQTAFYKMLQLIYGFSSEVAWHGTVYRDEAQPNAFRIEDIFVYPQLVSGANVETDQVAYQSWLYSLDDEVFNNLRMQGHSHVDFTTTPSTVDTTHQGKILEQLDDDMFYIFMIWNKKMERTVTIFDLANNTLYEKDDVVITVDSGALEFLDNAKEIVKPKYQAPVTGFGSGAGTYSGPSYYNGTQNTGYKVQPAGSGAPASRPKPVGSTPPVGKSGAGYDPGYDDKTSYPKGYGHNYGSGR